MNGLRDQYRTPLAEDFPLAITLDFGDRKVELQKLQGLRYGENPHQPAAFYVAPGQVGIGSLQWLKSGKGGPSWTNIADIEHALRILRYFDMPAALVMKHLNPSGFATGRQSGRETYAAARDADARAAFGGVVGLNYDVDREVAEEILATYVEVVFAPAFTDEALALLERKADLRVARCSTAGLPRYREEALPDAVELKACADGSLLLQAPFLSRVRTAADFELSPTGGGVTARVVPTDAQCDDLLVAWHVNLGVRSNGVVIVRDCRTLAIGTGEQERIGAVEQAIAKARAKGHDLRGAVLASDGFFPFRDAIDACAAAGISAIAQPGGSQRDAEVIAACNEHGIAMVFTGERCFAHF